MCRAKDEGPRCSNGGRIRKERAERYAKEVNAKAEAELAANGKLSKHTQWQVDNVQRRSKQALVVWYATPAGVRELTDARNQEEHRLSKLPVGKPGTREALAVNRCKRKIKQLDKTIDKGVLDRKIMYENERLLNGEKRELRNKAMAQGANINKRAQKASQEEIDKATNADKDLALSLKEWDDATVTRLAPHWVEEGSRTGWVANDSIRPPKGGEGEKVVPSVSNMIGMNMPDGTVAEGKHDIHVTKNAKGEYVVSQRYTAASSWEDVGPLDTTAQELGHLIASKRGFINRRSINSVEKFKSENEALAHVKKAKNSISQTFAKNLASDARKATINRAAKSHGTQLLSNRGRQAGRHLYSADGSNALS